MVGLIILVGFLYICYLAYKGVEAFNQGLEYGRQKNIADSIKQGRKPIGQSFGQQFGSAYLMSPQQIISNEIGISEDRFFEHRRTNDFGFLLLGISAIPSRNASALNTLCTPGHLLTVAPTRTGKGTCAVIPNLLTYSGSVIVNDIKGENYAVTWRARRMFGHKVIKIAPFSRDSSHWNPFDILRGSDDIWDDARHMAELLITDTFGKDEFWNNSARNLLTGLILFIHQLDDEEKHTLSYLRTLLTQDQEDFELTLAEMVNSENTIAARAANVFLRADTKVQNSILSTLDSELAFLDSEKLMACTKTADFNFKDLKKRKISVYLIIPPERLRTYAPFIRLFMGMAALELKRTNMKPKYPVLMLLDEFPALGRMKVIEEEISYLSGYNVRLWLFAQDLKQLATIYGENAQSIIANCAVKQFFGVADIETAQLVSRMCGNTTVTHVNVSSHRHDRNTHRKR